MADHKHDQAELFEEEIMWPESYTDKSTTTDQQQQYYSKRSAARKIPARNRQHCGCRDDEEEDMDGKIKEEVLVPPHELVSKRRTEGEMAFSICSGVGRTLKGRDLYYLRNSVLRMTGFIES